MAATDGSTGTTEQQRAGDGRTAAGGRVRSGRRLAIGLAGLALGVGALAACSSGSPPPAADNGTVTVTSTTTGPLSTSRPATATPEATGSGTAAQPSPTSTSRPATQPTTEGQVDTAIGVYADCSTRSVEPTSIELACADKKSGLVNLRWTSWTPQEATAVGTLYYYDCVPDCAARQPVHNILNAQVTLLDPVLDTGGHRVWARIAIHPQVPGYATGPFHGGPEPLPTHSDMPTCSGSDLAVTGSGASGGLGHGGLVLVFTNHSNSRCAIQGYPGAAGVNAGGAQVVQAGRTLTGYLGGCHCAQPQTVTLAPGQQASSLLEGDTGGGVECLTATSVLVTPPDAETSTLIPIRVNDCHLQIHPVLPGTTGGGF